MLRVPVVVAIVVFWLTGEISSAQAPRPMFPPRDNAAAPQAGTARIRGRVTAADTGAPLRRAQISVASPEAGLRRLTTTDADGRYEFAELPSGRYSVTAAKGGYVALQSGQQRPFEPGNPIALADGETLANVDIALPRGSVITGRITDEFGEPIAMAQVSAQRYQYGPGGQRRLMLSGGGPMTMTDDLGQFRVYGLMPGEYVVSAVVRQMGFSMVAGSVNDASEGFAPTFYPATTNLAEAQPVTIGVGQELSLHIALSAGRMARVSGSVVDSQGKPPVGAMIMLRSGTLMMPMATAQVAADGAFSLTNVPPGEHVIDVRPMGRGADAAVEFASMPIAVGNENISGLRIATAAGARVKGRVVFDGAAPRTGGVGPPRVYAQPEDPQSPTAGLGFMMGPGGGVIAEDGTFELGNLTGKVLFRAATPPNWTLRSVTIDGEDMTDTAYEFKGAQGPSEVRIIMTDKLTEVTGSVTDDRGRALANYVVILLPEEPITGTVAMRYTRTTRPDQQGAYSVRGLPPGRYVLAAVQTLEQGREWEPEFQSRVRDVARSLTLREGQSVTVDLKLTTGL